jgi:hypothetical protein
MHLVCFWPSPTSKARRGRQRGASGVRWWVGTARFCVQKGCFFRVKNDPIFASFDTVPSPHRRINAPSLLLAFAHVQGEVGTPTGGVGSAVVGRNSPVLCARGVLFPVQNDPIFASFDTAPSPYRRINAPSLLLAFAHVQGEAGTPTGGVGSAVVGRNSPVLCAGGVLLSQIYDKTWSRGSYLVKEFSAVLNVCIKLALPLLLIIDV